MGFATVYVEKEEKLPVKRPRTPWGQRLFVRALFTLIWRHHLIEDDTGRFYHVVAVKGWRTCLYDTKGGQRTGVTFLPRWCFWDRVK